MNRMKTRLKARLVVILCLVASLLYPLFELNEYRIYLMNIGLINCIVASGIVFVTGFAGQISFGQAAFYAIGAYSSAILTKTYKVPLSTGMAIGALISLLLGLALSIPSFKLRAFFLSLVTIGFGQIVHMILINWRSVTGGSYGFFGIPPMKIGGHIFSYGDYYLILLLTLMFVIFVMYKIRYSYIGKCMLAINDDEIAASTCGVNVKKLKMFAFAFSAVVASIAGSIYAHMSGFLTPEPFSFFQSSNFVAMAVIGGLRSILGGLIGGMVLTILPELLRLGKYRGWENYYLIVTSLIVIAIVVRMPKGLSQIPHVLLRRARRNVS